MYVGTITDVFTDFLFSDWLLSGKEIAVKLQVSLAHRFQGIFSLHKLIAVCVELKATRIIFQKPDNGIGKFRWSAIDKDFNIFTTEKILMSSCWASGRQLLRVSAKDCIY
ncbi:hypothetical protein [Geotalea toluenoxydans]|uniref:hypothetical protein n=1 Tax=Geotalea toluenoxydans TaxID=421624 RepID=UPI001FB4DF8A|nr:hypothetical protein [Geotalea toluenoxydans]